MSDTLQKIRESAKDLNSKDPYKRSRAQEIKRRYEQGLFNTELEAEGAKPIPIKPPQPKIDTSKLDMSKVDFGGQGPQSTVPNAPMLDLSISKSSLKERGGDILETARGMGTQISKGAEKIQDVWQNDSFNVLQKFMGTVGAAAGAGAGVIGEGFTGVGKYALTQEGEEAFVQKMQEIGQAASETEVARGVMDWYEGLNEDEKLIVDSAGGVLELAAELVGVKGTGRVTSTAIETATPIVRQGTKRALEFGAEQVKNAQSLISDARSARRTAQVAAQQEKVQTAVERITQAGDDPRAVEQATRALSDIDTSNIKTYEELNDAFDDRIVALSRQVDARLESTPDTFKPDDFAKTTKVGDEVVKESPISEALDGLENAYAKSGEAVGAAHIRQLKQKFVTEGLTLKEANDLAREYGIEFRDRAFTKLGDPKAGYNAENYENVRKGVKEVIRDKMPDDTTKQLDQKMSDIYATRDMTRKLSDKVAKLEQRIKNRTLAQKAGGALAALLDFGTAGVLRGFVAKILPSNVGNKAMNSIEIQAELQKNLRQIEKLLEIKDGKSFDDAVIEYINNIQPGLSIRSTVRPDNIAKAMDAEDFRNVTKIIDDPSTRIRYEDMLRGMGLQNAADGELVSFLKEVVDEYEGVASRPVLDQ